MSKRVIAVRNAKIHPCLESSSMGSHHWKGQKKIPYDIVGSTIEKAVVTPFGLRTKGWFAWISGILVLKGIKIHWSCHPDKCIKAWGTLGMVD